MHLGSKIVGALDGGVQLLRTAVGRVIASSASLIALAIFLWPEKDWHFDPAKFFAFLIALGSSLVSVLPERRPSVHDRELFAKFQSVMTPDWLTWLRRHDFGGSFPEKRLQPLFEIDSEWEGAAYSFDDPVLRARFDPVVEKICEFAQLVALNTWPIRGERWQTAVPNGEESLEEEHVRERVAKLNGNGTELLNGVESFIRYARRRLDQSNAEASPQA